MENHDRELIRKVTRINTELRRLYEEHLILERKLSKYETMTFLTPSEEMEEKKLKRKKLQGVDRMMAIVSGHRTDIVRDDGDREAPGL